MGRGGWWDLTGSSCSIQGFWYFARSRSREIQVNRRNPAIFTKTQKIPQNSVEILSNTCLYHIFETYFSYRSYLLVVNLQIYLGTSSLKRANNLPKLPGVDYVAKNCALAMMLKALPLAHFWSALLLKEQKRSKCWSDQRKFRVKFALKITTKSAVFYRLLFSEVYPENSRLIYSQICLQKTREIWLFLPWPIRSPEYMTTPLFIGNFLGSPSLVSQINWDEKSFYC